MSRTWLDFIYPTVFFHGLSRSTIWSIIPLEFIKGLKWGKQVTKLRRKKIWFLFKKYINNKILLKCINIENLLTTCKYNHGQNIKTGD